MRTPTYVRLNSPTKFPDFDNLDFVRKWHPEFENTPAALIPWPYRTSDCPEPEFCPKCGRRLVQYVWYGFGDDEGYLETGCAGRAQRLLGWRPSMLGFWIPKHFNIGLDKVRRKARLNHDPVSGDPMDGPPNRRP